jgi:hypothetical protein
MIRRVQRGEPRLGGNRALEQLRTAGEQVVADGIPGPRSLTRVGRTEAPAVEELGTRRGVPPSSPAQPSVRSLRSGLLHELRGRQSLRRALLLHAVLGPPRAWDDDAAHRRPWPLTDEVTNA